MKIISLKTYDIKTCIFTMSSRCEASQNKAKKGKCSTVRQKKKENKQNRICLFQNVFYPEKILAFIRVYQTNLVA